MGGANTKPINCGEYSTAKAIETDYELYANSVVITGGDLSEWIFGLLFVPFFPILIWFMNAWVTSYFNAMNDILNCGIKGEIEAKYGEEFYLGSF